MKNEYVVKLYVAGEEEGKSNNLRIEGDKLFSYFTCIAQRLIDENGKVSYIVNNTKYSKSTTTIQNMVMNHIPNDLIITQLRDVDMGASSLN